MTKRHRSLVADLTLLSAQDARIGAEAAASATRAHLTGLTAFQATAIAQQLRRTVAAALRTANLLDRHAAELTRRGDP